MKIFRIVPFIFLVILSSCETDNEEIAPVEVINNASITVDGKQTEFINEAIWGNTNCDFISVGISNYFEDDEGYTIKFNIGKDGGLRSVKYRERLPAATTGNIYYFLTPSFNPVSSMIISNFSYDEIRNDIYFEFSGRIYREDDNSIIREVQGTVDVKNHLNIACDIDMPLIDMTYNSGSFSFNSFFHSRSIFSNGIQRHRFFSNNGYRIELISDQNIGDFPIGNYALTENSTSLFLDLYQYSGVLLATQSPTIVDLDWTKYKTRGNLIISERIETSQEMRIKGHLNIEVLDQNQVIYTIDGMDFILYGN